jgi:hypothetical protein
VKRSDELWIFGPVSNGVLAEVQIANKNGKPVRYFAIVDSKDIKEVTKKEVELEDEVADQRHLL